jgi:hypothetical protein
MTPSFSFWGEVVSVVQLYCNSQNSKLLGILNFEISN